MTRRAMLQTVLGCVLGAAASIAWIVRAGMPRERHDGWSNIAFDEIHLGDSAADVLSRAGRPTSEPDTPATSPDLHTTWIYTGVRGDPTVRGISLDFDHGRVVSRHCDWRRPQGEPSAAGDSGRVARVRGGMSRDDVRGWLGQPDTECDSIDAPSNSRWWYRGSPAVGTATLTIEFEDGRVVAVSGRPGRLGDIVGAAAGQPPASRPLK